MLRTSQHCYSKMDFNYVFGKQSLHLQTRSLAFGYFPHFRPSVLIELTAIAREAAHIIYVVRQAAERCCKTGTPCISSVQIEDMERVAIGKGGLEDGSEVRDVCDVPSREKLSFNLRRWLAKSESFLSTHGFGIVFLASYTIASSLMFFWGAYEEYNHSKTPVLRWFISIARGCGYLLNLNCGLVILLASRLAFTAIRETPLNLVIPFDKSFPTFHMIVGYVIFGAACGHGTFHLLWIIGWNRWGGGLWGINMCAVSGLLLAGILVLMVISSVPRVRRNRFRLFYFLHNLGALFFFVLLLFHGVYNGVPYTYKWIVAPLVIYAFDRLLRRVKIVTSNVTLSDNNSELKGANILRLSLPKQFKYRAGQYAGKLFVFLLLVRLLEFCFLTRQKFLRDPFLFEEIKVKTINKYEWHLLFLRRAWDIGCVIGMLAFTIASAPCEASMCFYIKALGDWTGALREAFEVQSLHGIAAPLKIQIRGPYGAPAQHVGGFQRVVLVSGGVGATPFCSICKDLYKKMLQCDEQPSNVEEKDEAESEDLVEAKMEIMSCITKAYEESTAGYDDETVEESEESLYSLNELFVATNEFNNCQSPVPLSVRDVLNRYLFLDTLDSENRKEKPLTMSGNGNQRLGEVKHSHSFDSSGITAGMEESQTWGTSFAKRTLCMDNFEAANDIRRQVIVSRKERALTVLHSIGVNLALYMLMLFRVVLVAYASIFNSVSLSTQSSRMFENGAITIFDVCLGLLMLATIAGSICLELLAHGRRFFRMHGRLIDLSLLAPLMALSVSCGLHAISEGNDKFFISPRIHLSIIIPLVMVLLIYRLHRIIGSRVLLADSSGDSTYENMRAVDFIWTTPFESDDDWLREELGKLANGKQLRLHRYITREERKPEEEEITSEDGLLKNYGRPQWEELFKKVAERTPTNGKVGVFFCGPKGMSKAIRNTIMKVQVLTNLRGIYLGTSCDELLASELQIANKSRIHELRSRGSNVRFVFREENFG